jgi:predicted Zn-dependent protease
MRRLAALAIALGLVLAPAHAVHAAVITRDQEIQIGRRAAADLEAEVGLSGDPALAARVGAIGRRIVAVSDRRDLPYAFKVLKGREVNAVALPGGFIYATEGLMRFVQSDAELAFVMAHEVGHIAAKHHVAMIERELVFGLLGSLLLGGSSAEQLGAIARFLLSRGFSRENEFRADHLGVTYTHRAGFDASAGLRFLERLRAQEGRDPGQVEVLLRTHPGLRDRIARVRDQLQGLGYRVGDARERLPATRPSRSQRRLPAARPIGSPRPHAPAAPAA